MIDCERCWTVLQKMQCKTSTNVLWFRWMFMSSTLEASVFMVKELLRQFTFHQKYRGKSHFKANVRDIWKVDSWTNQMRFLECLKSAGKILHGNSYLWSMMKKSSVSFMQRFMCSQILCYVLERWITTSTSNTAWVEQLELVQRFITMQNFGHNWRRTDGIRVEYFLRIHHIAALLQEVQKFMSTNWAKSQKNFTGRIIFMSMFNDISWWSKDNEQECELNAKLVSIYAKRFSPAGWLFLGPGSEKKCYSTLDSKPQGKWDRVAESMMVKFRESGHPVFRATSPLSRGTLKSKGGGQIINTLVRWWGNDWNCFSHNYFS